MSKLLVGKRKASIQESEEKIVSQICNESDSFHKPHNSFKKIVPIKQYSNKFFKQYKVSGQNPLSNTTSRSNKKNRVNSLVRKQRLFSASKRLIGDQTKHTPDFPNNASMIAISSFSKGNKQTRVKTQPSKNNISIENTETSICEIEQELILSSSFTKKLISPSSTFLMKNPSDICQFKAQEKSADFINDQKRNKISQSRGLQKYCKIFIKEKSEMVQKIWESKRKINKNVDKMIYSGNQNNFEAKKIIPLEKSNKKKTLELYYCKKVNLRTPMRTIENDQIFSRLEAIKEARNKDSEDYFQLNGWETTI